jgi:putative alpha-1,2-mannosidase
MRSFAVAAVLGSLVACGGGAREGLVLTESSGPLTMAMHVPSTIVGEPGPIRLVVMRGERPALGTAQIAWTMDGMPMTDRPKPLVQISPDTYEQRASVFSMSGTWHARVSFHEHDRGLTMTTFTIEVRE